MNNIVLVVVWKQGEPRKEWLQERAITITNTVKVLPLMSIFPGPHSKATTWDVCRKYTTPTVWRVNTDEDRKSFPSDENKKNWGVEEKKVEAGINVKETAKKILNEIGGTNKKYWAGDGVTYMNLRVHLYI